MQLLTENIGFCLQLLIGKFLNLRFQLIDLLNQGI